MNRTLTESVLTSEAAIYDYTVPAGEPWLYEVKRGQTLRIVDLMGNQAVDTLFYNAQDPAERYSAVDTIRAQGSIYLTTGSPPALDRWQCDADDRRRHLRPSRHPWRCLCGRVEPGALCPGEAADAQLPRQLPAGARGVAL